MARAESAKIRAWPWQRSLGARLNGAVLLVAVVMMLGTALGFAVALGPGLFPRQADYNAVAYLARVVGATTDDAARARALRQAAQDLGWDLAVVRPDGAEIAHAGGLVPRLPAAQLQRGAHAITALGVARAGPLLAQHGYLLVAPLSEAQLLVVHAPLAMLLQPFPVRPLAALVLGVALVLVVTLLIARSATRPLAQLCRTAEALGRGELSVRSGISARDEVGQLALAFDAMAERLSDQRRRERVLLANVSHALKTPLARVRMALALVGTGEGDGASNPRVAAVEEELTELERLVADVLLVSRLDLATLPLRVKDVALDELVDRSVRRVRALMPRCAIDVKVPALRCHADAVLLARALDNLLDNARRYGRGAPVRVLGEQRSERILLAIEDDGPGISPADRERLFQPFFRGSEGLRDSSGSGLGLLLSRQIVEAHGGHLRVVAAASGGARVEVELVR